MVPLAFKQRPLIIFSAFLLFSSNFFPFIHGSLEYSHQKFDHFQGIQVLEKDSSGNTTSQSHDGVKQDAASGNYTLVLAANRTHRKDPLNNFKYYEGGWDPTSISYGASLAFTGVPLYGLAVAWFLVVGISLIICCICCYCCCCCCRGRKCGHSRIIHACSLTLLVLFTGVAIAGCAVLNTAEVRFYKTTSNVVNYLKKQVGSVLDNIIKILSNLDAAKKFGIGQFSLPQDLQNVIDSANKAMKGAAYFPKTQLQKITNQFTPYLHLLEIGFITLTVAMLVLSLLGLVFSFCGLRVLVFILVILGWILVTLTLLLCGTALIVHNAVGDTCTAMGDYLEHPSDQSAISKLLPCMDLEKSQETLATSRNVTFQVVNTINAFIVNVANKDIPPNSSNLYYSQSGPLVPLLCNPYDSDVKDRKCPVGEVELGNATLGWKDYVCSVSASGVCTTIGRLTPTGYTQLTSAANLTNTLYEDGPFLVNLVDCTFVRESFREISKTYCPGLETHSYQVFIGLLMVSTPVMVSLVFWVVFARERQHKVAGKKFKRTHM